MRTAHSLLARRDLASRLALFALLAASAFAPVASAKHGALTPAERAAARAKAPFGHRITRLLAERRPEGVKIYYHLDLDGVASAMAMAHFLKQKGVSRFEFQGIEYGGEEYTVSGPKAGWLSVLVDFAHGKPFMDVHTDHHDRQTGTAKERSFVKGPSNATYLSGLDPRQEAFDATDRQVIDMVDSAGYADRFTPAEVRRFLFRAAPDQGVTANRLALGLVTNKLLLAAKGKQVDGQALPNVLLGRLVAADRPSLRRLYVELRRLGREQELETPERLQEKGDTYVVDERARILEPDAARIPTLEVGQSMRLGNVAVKYGAKLNWRQHAYDRYVAFDLHPEAQFLCVGWPMGLVQASVNAFLGRRNPQALGQILLGPGGVLSAYEAELKATQVSLGRIKQVSERELRDAPADALGFRFSDFVGKFAGRAKINGLSRAVGTGRLATLRAACDKRYSDLTEEDRALLDSVWVSGWDVVRAESGGHPNIAQISGLSFLPHDFRGGTAAFVKELMGSVAGRLRDATLEPRL
ncbi:MAG: hypothetical protein IT371_30925 [Deltaproteobacteria bacterium]|nr:hypothetical protein [Deltaproteobacteria bacterium]